MNADADPRRAGGTGQGTAGSARPAGAGQLPPAPAGNHGLEHPPMRCPACGRPSVPPPRPDCACGDGWALHDIPTSRQPCSRALCDCASYRPMEVAA